MASLGRAALLLALLTFHAALRAQQLPGGLFRLREMDFHLHAGMERPVEMARWIDLAVADGRRALLLLDHLELYRKTPEARYPLGAAGHKALFDDFDRIARRKDVLVFKGWEIGEDELDSGIEAAAGIYRRETAPSLLTERP